MRIHIIGASGSGKSTLAAQLSAATSAPWYELDCIGYAQGAGRQRPLARKLSDVAALATQAEWITEGIFLGWTNALLEQADTLIWLDLPWRTAAWRIVARHARLSWQGTNRHRGLRNLSTFVLSQRSFYTQAARVPRALDDDGAVNRASIAQALAPYAARVVACRSAGDVRRALQRLGGDPHQRQQLPAATALELASD